MSYPPLLSPGVGAGCGQARVACARATTSSTDMTAQQQMEVFLLSLRFPLSRPLALTCTLTQPEAVPQPWVATKTSCPWLILVRPRRLRQEQRQRVQAQAQEHSRRSLRPSHPGWIQAGMGLELMPPRLPRHQATSMHPRKWTLRRLPLRNLVESQSASSTTRRFAPKMRNRKQSGAKQYLMCYVFQDIREEIERKCSMYSQECKCFMPAPDRPGFWCADRRTYKLIQTDNV
jgi:hypothetical protein